MPVYTLPVLGSPSDRSQDIVDHASIARDLTALVEGEVRFGGHDRLLYATDASIYQVEPIGVVIPRTIADVEASSRTARITDCPSCLAEEGPRSPARR